MKTNYYIGLMSGTSADGIDLALVDFKGDKPVLVASFYQAYSSTTQAKITQLYQSSINEIDMMGELDIALAKHFADAINQFLAEQSLTPDDICAIGNHGQTIRHRPPSTSQQHAFTLQIGCNDTLAALTGIRVIGQFRRKDIAYGGQGAPLVPAFHRVLLSDDQPLFIVNIGGIANITYLPTSEQQDVIGFDTGPGNALLDEWYQQHHSDKAYDENGQWAQQGEINTALLTHFHADPYFQLPAPKSTGREYFHSAWLSEKLNQFNGKNPLNPKDIQATLSALTSTTIAEQIKALSATGKVYLCGGGAHNDHLKSILKQQLKKHTVTPMSSININGDALEAMAFAWFAYAFDKKICSNIPSVTGANKALVLGSEYLA
ncbi:anhydro-N-acetylmuramic acid kinase [Thalassotalea sp. LPB0316]|uniref:anhydro-N-acetylmuramic acid kinase n=1 Tax=Thalassotalea sp. LPB0316 TaxID=2769490 RepID=UPI001866EC94|nr:anhydro-N-acetylmuramic acid kinase [Thalassotalea sp. LPB0316]QOL26065.1 anhydro-N-acetylmuramic acid kinase [Thalassotalea sp. LPB0316]